MLGGSYVNSQAFSAEQLASEQARVDRAGDVYRCAQQIAD
ncbi:oxidoreductase, FAD-binding protein, partial [Pseudomonas savastanoi pv. glycinea str. race 4]